MGRIHTKAEGPTQRDLAEVPSAFSLYRQTHFYKRKTPEELERRAQQAAKQRTRLARGKVARLQLQIGL